MGTAALRVCPVTVPKGALAAEGQEFDQPRQPNERSDSRRSVVSFYPREALTAEAEARGEAEDSSLRTAGR